MGRSPKLSNVIEVDFSGLSDDVVPLRIPKGINSMSRRKAALAYAAEGIYVGPAAPGTKNPGSLLGKGWDKKTSKTPAEIKAWFIKWPNAGVFIHAGRSNIGIFDVDIDDLTEAPAEISSALATAPFQRSRGNGDRGHYFFATDEPLGNGAGAFSPYGDVRGKNGVVLSSPSIHPDTGLSYEWVRVGPIPDLPPALRAMTSQTSVASKPSLGSTDLEKFRANHSVSNHLEKLEGPLSNFRSRVEQGESRHGAMVAILGWVIREIRTGDYSANTAIDALQKAWGRSFSSTGSRTPAPDEFDNMVRWAAAQPDEKEASEEIWGMTPELTLIRQFAQDHGVGPWGLLGIGIIRGLLSIPAYVCLPATVGTPAPPNLLLAIVAKSGAGKGNSEKLARRLFPFTPAVEEDVFQGSPGSGEGVAKMFGSRQKIEGENRSSLVYEHTRVLLSAPEVDSLKAMMGRDSSTLSETLRKAGTGEALGYGYANKDKNVPVGDDRYRLCMQVGVQPLRADALFGEASGGLPQRFVWVTVNDPNAKHSDPASHVKDVIRLPEWPQDYSRTQAWKRRMSEPADYEELTQLTIPKSVEDVIRDENLKRRREDPFETSDAEMYDGHRLLVIEKVALGIAVLHGNTHGFDEIHWDMAQRFMIHSDTTRQMTEQVMRDETQKKHLARAKAEGRSAVIRDDTAHKTMSREMRETVLQLLKEGPKTGNFLKQKFGTAKREILPDVLNELRATDKLITREQVKSGNTKGYRYSLS